MPRQTHYTIENERLSAQEVLERVPQHPVQATLKRLDRGVRTWAGLHESPAAASARSRQRVNRRPATKKGTPL